MTECKIGNCVVDFARCQIINGGEVTSVEPKVMDVLGCLYQDKNQVVSQQKIFDRVWPKAIFNPSSVQRSIAILRKVIEQDTRSPQFIITHPKRGYCLILDDDPQPKKPVSTRHALPLSVACVLLLIAGAFLLTKANDAEVKTDFSLLKPLTSSENSERDLAISPKGDVVAFIRKENGRQSHIWLKKLSSGEEYQATRVAGRFNKLGWSKDGNALVFVKRQDGKESLAYITIDPYTLATSLPLVLSEFPEWSIISYQLQWASTGDIYFVQTAENTQTLLRRFSVTSGELHTLKTFQGQEQLFTVALSPDEDTLALAFDIHQNKYRIDLLMLDNLEARHIATLENQIHGLSWHPNNQSLLVSNRDKLRLLKTNGELSNINFDNFKYIRNAHFSNDGQRILMELMSVDVDILYSGILQPTDYQVLVDTQSLDFLPIYSPKEDRFAFESHRNGLKQLFVYEEGRQRLVFSNPDNRELFGFVWSADGKRIITASNNTLFVIDVQSASYHELPHKHGSFYLREWYQHQNALLVSLVTDDGVQPGKFDLNILQLSLLSDFSPNFECSYMSLDQQDRIYLSDNKHIYRLNEQKKLELMWQAKRGKITGFTLADKSFSVKLDHPTSFELVKVSNQGDEEVQLMSSHYDAGIHFTSTTKEADKYLFSQVKDIKQLVQLR